MRGLRLNAGVLFKRSWVTLLHMRSTKIEDRRRDLIHLLPRQLRPRIPPDLCRELPVLPVSAILIVQITFYLLVNLVLIFSSIFLP
jgi:hypothetical protein